jgi:hypothetical protein
MFKLELRREFEGKTFKELPSFKLTNDKCFTVDAVNIGDEVQVNFSLGGKYSVYNDKVTGEEKKFHRTELTAHSVKKLAIEPANSTASTGGLPPSATPPNPNFNSAPQPSNPLIDTEYDDTDLPF